MGDPKQVTVMDNETHEITFGHLEVTGITYYHIRPYVPAQPQEQRAGVKKIVIEAVTLFDGFRFDLHEKWTAHTYAVARHDGERQAALKQVYEEEEQKVGERVVQGMLAWDKSNPHRGIPPSGFYIARFPFHNIISPRGKESRVAVGHPLCRNDACASHATE